MAALGEARADQPIIAALDASGTAAFAIDDERYHVQAQQVIADLDRQGARLIAPPLWECEVDSILRRRVYLGTLQLEAAIAARRVINALRVEIIQDQRVRDQAWQMAERFNQIRVYDCTYAALAHWHQCNLWTADERFYNSVHLILPYVRFVGSYTITPTPLPP